MSYKARIIKGLAALALLLTGILPAGAAAPEEVVVADTVLAVESPVENVREAFLRMPADRIDILDRSARLDMLEYLKVDSLCRITNDLQGMSVILPPVTSTFLKVQLTPVSAVAIKELPYKGKKIFAVSNTVAPEPGSADSELHFFDCQMKPMRADKMLKTPSLRDFLSLDNVDSSTRRELESLVPFPTIEYAFSPDSGTVTATLTSEGNMSREDFAKLEPYLRSTRIYRWDGHSFRLEK